MNGSTKILTVSYGTFSCTLEGFDDPLGSMREMAEYFRDLAADDRYFGAEPPTPDVEMLQRIAEKEVQRRVEARVTNTGIALVAAEPTPEPEPEAPEPELEAPVSPEPAPAAEPAIAKSETPQDGTSGPLTYDDDFLMPDEPEDVLSVDPDATVEAAGPAESVAEKLRRIREVVSRNMISDQDAMHREQAPNAENPELRDRALTETIQQIQSDISEDENTAADIVADHPVEEDDAAQTVAEPPSEAPAEDADTLAQAQEWDFEPELLGGDDADDDADGPAEDGSARTLTEMIGSLSDRLAKEAQVDETADAEAPQERITTRTLSPEPEADVGRLLDETDSKLNDNETVRRRRVISQMRAAVAATKADRLVSTQVSKEAREEAEKDRYREDLSEAVQEEPRAEQAADAPLAVSTRQPSAPPLVLVSSQRIDSETRAAGTKAADFAAKFGAKELPELMEAAAAFTIFSEGQSSFTRPEIMQMVTRMDPSLSLSREESLRSFGQLLRDGTFKKLERGQFTIDQGTKYNPEERAAGT